MAIIKYDLLPKQKTQSRNLKVNVDLYPYASDLFEELTRIGIIKRLKDIPQLGLIKVPKRLKKSRLDYTMLQLFFHQLIKKNLQTKLKFTYNNIVKADEFSSNSAYKSSQDKPTVGDMLQLLTIAYNLGHFYNTFTASRAVIMFSADKTEFRELIMHSSTNERFIGLTEKLLHEKNYQRLHLLNSLLVLEHCDQNKQSVILAQELLYAYLNEKDLDEESKLTYVFYIFRKVRDVSYMAYDLQVAEAPLTIDLCNQDTIISLFNELLSVFNDQLPATQLISSIGKILDDTVYNENSNAICYYRISQKIKNEMNKVDDLSTNNYYEDLFLNRESLFNKPYTQTRDYSSSAILKLTFCEEDKILSQQLLNELSKIYNSRVGYYDRYSGEQTILVSIKKNCLRKDLAAYKILKTSMRYLRNVSCPSNADTRYLLISKFFLYYFFGENPIVLEATVDPEICVLCTRGKNCRSSEIKSVLAKGLGSTDKRHEVEFMLDCLVQDTINDTSIMMPCSILVFDKKAPGKKKCEFDGIVIHPMRVQDQIILFEAKKTLYKPLFAKNCLSKKLDSLCFEYAKDSIITTNHDAQLKLSIK